MTYRMIIVKKMLVDVVHRLTLFFNICHKFAFIICCPCRQSVLRLQFTKGRCSVSDDCINGKSFIDGIEFVSVINWSFINPIHISV